MRAPIEGATPARHTVRWACDPGRPRYRAPAQDNAHSRRVLCGGAGRPVAGVCGPAGGRARACHHASVRGVRPSAAEASERSLTRQTRQPVLVFRNPSGILQINFQPEVELSGGGNLFVAFRRAASGQHAATPGGRPRVEASRAPPHTHAPQLLRTCGIGSGPTGEKPHVSRCVLCYRTIFF